MSADDQRTRQGYGNREPTTNKQGQEQGPGQRQEQDEQPEEFPGSKKAMPGNQGQMGQQGQQKNQPVQPGQQGKQSQWSSQQGSDEKEGDVEKPDSSRDKFSGEETKE